MISGRIIASPSWASCRQTQRSAAPLMMAEILAAWARPRLSTEAGSTFNPPGRWRRGGEIISSRDLVAENRAGPAPAPRSSECGGYRRAPPTPSRPPPETGATRGD